MSGGGLDALELEGTHAVFFDFDGVLGEIGPDPDAVRLPADTHRHLAALAAALSGAVALLSGRDVRDLAARTPPALWRAGGHGLEVVPPGGAIPDQPPPPPDAVLRILGRVAERPGVRLELKGPVVAIHYRAAPDAGPDCLAAAEDAAAAVPDHVAQAGKMVVEVKPKAAHKGEALRRMSDAAPFRGRVPIMLGDDTTDEDAMTIAQEMGGLGVKVGEGASVARLRAPDPVAVRSWLAREATRLTS